MIAVPGSLLAMMRKPASRKRGSTRSRMPSTNVCERTRAITGGIVSWIACWASKPRLPLAGSIDRMASERKRSARSSSAATPKPKISRKAARAGRQKRRNAAPRSLIVTFVS